VRNLLGPRRAWLFSPVAKGTAPHSPQAYCQFLLLGQQIPICKVHGGTGAAASSRNLPPVPGSAQRCFHQEVSLQWGEAVLTSFRRHRHNQVSWRCINKGRGNKTRREMYLFPCCPWETRSKQPLLSPAGAAFLLPPSLFFCCRAFSSLQPDRPKDIFIHCVDLRQIFLFFLLLSLQADFF